MLVVRVLSQKLLINVSPACQIPLEDDILRKKDAKSIWDMGYLRLILLE